MNEQRRQKRYPVSLNIQFALIVPGQAAEDLQWQKGELMTASETGIFLASDTQLEKGDYLIIDLPFKSKTVRVYGEVRWLSDVEDKGVSGAGVFLSKLTSELRSKIMASIESGHWLVAEEDEGNRELFSADIEKIFDDLDID